MLRPSGIDRLPLSGKETGDGGGIPLRIDVLDDEALQDEPGDQADRGLRDQLRVGVGLLQGWLGALAGSYWRSSLVAALVILTVGVVAAGLHRLLGLPGVVLTALTVIVLGVPLAGAAAAPEMLPTGWGAVGQWLPAGAGSPRCGRSPSSTGQGRVWRCSCSRCGRWSA